MDGILKILLKVLVLIGSVALVMIGQGNIGFQGLATMLAGLAGILGLLYNYNKAHQ